MEQYRYGDFRCLERVGRRSDRFRRFLRKVSQVRPSRRRRAMAQLSPLAANPHWHRYPRLPRPRGWMAPTRQIGLAVVAWPPEGDPMAFSDQEVIEAAR